MKLFIIFASAAFFFVLQAVYWIRASRRASAQAALLGRLGQDESLKRNDLLRQGQDESGAFAQRIVALQEEAGEEPNFGAFLGRVGIAFLIAFMLVLLITSNPLGAFLFGLIASGLPYLMLTNKKHRRVARCEEQLPEALEVMTISLRAGHSLEQTIRLTATELDAPIGDEFRRVADECGLGLPLEEALVNMSNRLKAARIVRSFVVSVLVLRQTGGNLVEVLDSIIDTMRMQSQYERKLQAMTAEGRSSSRILALLPPGFVVMTYLMSPDYMLNLFEYPMGRIILVVAALLYLGGIFWVHRLTSSKAR